MAQLTFVVQASYIVRDDRDVMVVILGPRVLFNAAVLVQALPHYDLSMSPGNRTLQLFAYKVRSDLSHSRNISGTFTWISRIKAVDSISNKVDVNFVENDQLDEFNRLIGLSVTDTTIYVKERVKIKVKVKVMSWNINGAEAVEVVDVMIIVKINVKINVKANIGGRV